MQIAITRLLTTLLPAVLLFVGTAPGQYAQRTMRATVPFEFTVGNKIFSAGEYSIVNPAPDRLDVRDSRGHLLALLVTHNTLPPINNNNGGPRLIFFVVGGEHVLAQVWMESSIGYELPSPKPDFVMAKRRSPVPAQTTSAGAGHN
jgi:hypothetical protein